MEIRTSIANAGVGERESHHFVTDESTEHLTADFRSDHVHLRRNNIALAEAPYRKLELDHLLELGHSMAMTYDYGWIRYDDRRGSWYSLERWRLVLSSVPAEAATLFLVRLLDERHDSSALQIAYGSDNGVDQGHGSDIGSPK